MDVLKEIEVVCQRVHFSVSWSRNKNRRLLVFVTRTTLLCFPEWKSEIEIL